MKNPFISKRGLILTEVLMALAILGAMIIALGSLIENAVGTTKVSKDYFIAQNMLTEGLEVVKTVRDSNWLTLPSKRNCWLTVDPADNLNFDLSQDCIINVATLTSQSFIPVFDNNYWLLSGQGPGHLGLTGENAEAASQNKYRVYVREAGDFTEYFQGLPNNKKSRFYRSIKFLDPVDADVVAFEVRVQWLDGRKARTLSVKERLYNYL